jgi:hypothetical protein
MPLVMTVTKETFDEVFSKLRPNTFTAKGLQDLFSYFGGRDERIEFNAVDLCCSYTEATLEGICLDYTEHNYDRNMYDDISYFYADVYNWFKDETMVLTPQPDEFEAGTTIVFLNF